MNGDHEKIRANIERYRQRLGRHLEVGLLRAGLALQRESQLRVPVDTGNLKASAFTRLEGEGLDAQVAVGYTAGYALYVHEAVGMKLKGKPRRAGTRPGGKGWLGRYWDPQGRAQPKFLQAPADEMTGELREIVRRELAKATR